MLYIYKRVEIIFLIKIIFYFSVKISISHMGIYYLIISFIINYYIYFNIITTKTKNETISFCVKINVCIYFINYLMK